MSAEMYFVVETGAFEDGNPQCLLEKASARGLRCNAVEFSDGNDANLAPADALVIAYGSLGMVRGMMMQNRWKPVAWLDAVALACHNYYPAMRAMLVQKEYRFVKWGDLPARLDELLATVGSGGRMFVRPDDCWKTFAGRVLMKTDFPQWHRQNTACYDIAHETMCVVAAPQQIVREWRCVILGRRVVASSGYVGEGRNASTGAVPAEVIALAERAAAKGTFDSMPVFTLDIAETAAGMFVMEPGCLNASSLYDCDMEAVLDAMLLAAKK